MNIYLVIEGSDHEGSSIHGAFSTYELANNYLETMPPNLFSWPPGPDMKTYSMNSINKLKLDVIAKPIFA